jgi:hypothetical protein
LSPRRNAAETVFGTSTSTRVWREHDHFSKGSICILYLGVNALLGLLH